MSASQQMLLAIGGAVPSFSLPLDDLGNGIVNLVPNIALGSPTPTFTRASVAWAKLANGLYTQVATGTARSKYLGMDTAVGAYGGYFSEPAGIQLVTPTASIRDMTDASWVKVNVTAAKNATGIDGVGNSASTITATAGGGTILQTLVGTAVRTYSAFVRRKTGTGTLVIQQGATTLDVTAQLNSVTYTRVWLNANIVSPAFGFTIGTNGDAFEVDINQFEALAATQNPSSPMASAGAARAADDLTYSSAGNILSATGTAYAELSLTGPVTINSQMAIGVNAGNFGPLRITATTASTEIAISDGTTAIKATGLTNMVNAVRKRASSWGANGQVITGDGATPATGAFNGAMPLAVIGIGNAGTAGFGNQWNGTIKNPKIFPTQITSAQLQAMTA